MKNKKIGLLLIPLLLMICILAGCGAVINTELNITKDFAGQRKIDVIINNDDLKSYVTGGINALKKAADSKLPSEMSCALSEVDDGSCLTFTIDFKSIDDYREKVAAVIDAGSNKELTPEIEYENLDTIFKKGVKLNENFTSFDLLQWYFDAVKEANIITNSSTSDWYEIKDNKIVLDSVEYDSYSKLSVNKQELCCLDSIYVNTILNIDGTFSREFRFLASDTTVEELSEKGCNLSSYISNLASEDDTYSESTDKATNEYIITVKADDTKQLVEKTNKILQTSNEFSLDIESNSEKVGNANVTIEEKLDGSFYLDYSSSDPLHSTIVPYDNNCKLIKCDNAEVLANDGKLGYTPSPAMKYCFDLDWKISFASVEIITDISSNDKAVVDFVFTSEETLQEDLKESAVEALKASCGEYGEFSENGDIATVSFTGSIDELNNKISSFIRSNDTAATEEKTYFEISFSKSETTSNFTNAYSGKITYDLSPIIGNTRITFNDVDGIFTDYYYQGYFATDDDGNKIINSIGEVSFTLVKFSFLIAALFIISCIVLIVGIILLVVKRKELLNIISNIKNKKKSTVIIENNNIPTVNVASVNIENIVDSTESETEEELI